MMLKRAGRWVWRLGNEPHPRFIGWVAIGAWLQLVWLVLGPLEGGRTWQSFLWVPVGLSLLWAYHKFWLPREIEERKAEEAEGGDTGDVWPTS